MSVHIIYVQTINPFIFSLILDIVFIQQSYSVTRGLQEQNKHNNWHDIADHYVIQFFSLNLLPFNSISSSIQDGFTIQPMRIEESSAINGIIKLLLI